MRLLLWIALAIAGCSSTQPLPKGPPPEYEPDPTTTVATPPEAPEAGVP